VAPRIVAVGIGPGGEELVTEGARAAIAGGSRVFLRTARHPSASVVSDLARVPVETFDDFYEQAGTFEEVYAAVVEALVSAAQAVSAGQAAHTGRTVQDSPEGAVVYVVPGSPLVAERTVELLRSDDRVEVVVVPGMSFMDLVWDRVGVDPVTSSVRIVDAKNFAVQAAGERGPLLLAQAHDRTVLSGVKLAVEEPPSGAEAAVILHHLGLADEVVTPLEWSELDRFEGFDPDHLTSVWIPHLASPTASEIVRLEELVRTLRQCCPWDREQTHGSLARHLLEEAYEALDAIEDVSASMPDVPEERIVHLEEELGDLAFQVVFHSVLASEEGWFTLADVARKVHDKLVGRHPHVFADAVAVSPEDVARRWEVQKRDERGRTSVTDGIPNDLPALALAAKLQRKAESVGIDAGGSDAIRMSIDGFVDRVAAAPGGYSGETLEADRSTFEAVGDALLALADLARRAGVDPESALRERARSFAQEIRAQEGLH
jgi:tetrapyrrole methylase family protein / MazG family protein